MGHRYGGGGDVSYPLFFEYMPNLKNPPTSGWDMGRWRLKTEGGQLPLQVTLKPVSPFNFLPFHKRIPRPEELEAYLSYRTSSARLFSPSQEWMRQLCLLLKAFDYLFRSKLKRGARIEIEQGTELYTFLDNRFGEMVGRFLATAAEMQ